MVCVGLVCVCVCVCAMSTNSACDVSTKTIREQEEDLRRLTEEREQTGVDLYDVQQHLSKLQMQLETLHERLNQYQQVFVVQ